MSTTHRSFIELLRAATVDEHRALERTPLMACLMDKYLSVADYTQVLLVFARFYATLDPLLSRATQHCHGLPEQYHYHARLPYLLQDLAALASRQTLNLTWQPACLHEMFAAKKDRTLQANAEAQRLTNEQIIGLLYVIEGSSQGGKIIAPRLAKRLELTDTSGLSFFHHFAFTATAWPRLQHMLIELPANGQAEAAKQHVSITPELVCDAACSLFQALTEQSHKMSASLACH